MVLLCARKILLLQASAHRFAFLLKQRGKRVMKKCEINICQENPFVLMKQHFKFTDCQIHQEIQTISVNVLV